MRLIECFIGESADLFILGRTLAGLYQQPGAKVKLRCVNWIKAPFSLALKVDGLKIAIEVWDIPHLDRNLQSIYFQRQAERSLYPVHTAQLHLRAGLLVESRECASEYE